MQIFRKSTGERGVHPLKAFFASIGGMLGVGNIIGIITAIQLGGPGALFWVWVAGFGGALIKYSEVYLGLKHRVRNAGHSYDGGPMFFLKKAFRSSWVPSLICVLLCIYGAEIYQFKVVVDTLVSSYGVNRIAAVALLLASVIYAAIGGTSRVSAVCSWCMPVFLFGYLGMCLWVIGSHYADLPSILKMVVTSAFTGHAAVGGFAGGSMLIAIQNGMASACYAADIGIGFDATIQSESSEVRPERQACIALFGVLLDNLVCTVSILVVLVTHLWDTALDAVHTPLIQIALARQFPFVGFIMPAFIFILGYTTLIAYLLVGIKCAKHLNPRKGALIYILYSATIISFFAFSDQTIALLVMRIAGALLLIINLFGVYRLRKEIIFGYSEDILEPSVIGA
jgi:AGCS family alanine or glycine:cation symporter